MTSYSHQLTQTKHKNRQTIETKDTCFSEENFIDRSFLVLEVLREGGGICATLPPWLHKPKKSMVNMVKNILLVKLKRQRKMFFDKHGLNFLVRHS